jgi:hypothetical protein
MAKDSPPSGILKGADDNQKLPEEAKKVRLDRMYTDKHLQKLAHAEVESESAE